MSRRRRSSWRALRRHLASLCGDPAGEDRGRDGRRPHLRLRGGLARRDLDRRHDGGFLSVRHGVYRPCGDAHHQRGQGGEPGGLRCDEQAAGDDRVGVRGMTKKPFDLLAEFGKFGMERKVSLRDAATASDFITHVGEEVERALADPVLLQGQRVEAMFEALLVSLGDFKLLKAEDGGRLFPTNGFRAPDFRIVVNDGSHWLIEVKNVYESDPFQQRRRLFTNDYYDTLAAYADATGAELKVALFWARWSIWTLGSPGRLLNADGGLELDLATAMRVNELARLADRMIATPAPLRLPLPMAPAPAVDHR